MQDRGEQQQPGQQGQWPQQPGGLQPPPAPYGYQPPAPVAAAKARSKWRTPLIALLSLGVGIAIGAAAGGSKSTPTTGAAGTTSSAAPSGSSPAAPAAVKSTAPAPAAPAKTVVLSISGEGQKSTKQFTVGAHWSLAYTYNCSNLGFQGNFVVTEQGGNNDGVPMLNQLGTKGGDTTYQHDDAGRHSLSVDSECKWTIKVTDGDEG